MVGPRPVEVLIEELVLEGVRREDRFRVAQALEEALERRLAREGVPDSLASIEPAERLDAGTIHVPVGARPEALGVQVGETIYRALGGAEGRVRD